MDYEVFAEPTSEQCSNNFRCVVGGRDAVAAWYPQMGGYVGRCWMFPLPEGCFDVWVYHDGEFPFHGEQPDDVIEPVVLHHCMAEQFVEFGELAKRVHEEMYG